MYRQADAHGPARLHHEGEEVHACDYCRRIGTVDTCMLLRGVQSVWCSAWSCVFSPNLVSQCLTANPVGDMFWCNTCKDGLMCAKWTAASTTRAGQFKKNGPNLCLLSLALYSQSDVASNDFAIVLAKDSGGRQPLHWSAGSGDAACVWMLLLCGADVLGRDAQVCWQPKGWHFLWV
jgi:hypothetical protein